MNGKNLIGFDSQGWALYKMSVRDILESLGCKHDEIEGKYTIDDSDPILDTYPRVLLDDGSGYGTQEKKIIEVNAHRADKKDKEVYCNMFIEEELDELDLWLKTEFFPMCRVFDNGIEYYANDIRNTEKGVEILCMNDTESRWILASELSWS